MNCGSSLKAVWKHSLLVTTNNIRSGGNMSGSGALQKKTSLHKLLDRFVDAQRLDIKAYSSGHLNELKLYCLPDQTPHTAWTGHKRPPVVLQPLSGTRVSAKTQTKVKKDALVGFTHDVEMKQHHKLKPLKSKEFSEFAETVDSKHLTCDVVASEILSTAEPLEGLCQASLDDHVLAEELHLSSSMASEQKNAKSFYTACTAELHQPVTGTFIPSVVPTYFKATTKKDQFRKMRDYHNNVIKHPTYAYQRAFNGSDAVKYLECRLQEV